MQRSLLSEAEPLSQDDTTERTLRQEKRRAAAAGVFETATGTFFLLIMVRWYQGGPIEKGICAGMSQAGLILSPLCIYIIRRCGIRATKAVSGALCIGGAALLLCAAFPSKMVFLVATVLAASVPAALTPVFTHIYQSNYPSERRGVLFSQSNSIRIIASSAFAALAGTCIDGRLHLYPILLVIFAASLFFSAWCVSLIPISKGSDKSLSSQETALLHGFSFLAHDTIFRQTIISWMLLGFGTLMMFPLRIEYLANPRYGVSLSEGSIALFVSVLPSLARLGGSWIWGRLFDTIDFFKMRMILNGSFIIGILSFFTSNSPLGLVAAALLFGLSIAGGDVAWNLWVTKVAPPNHVADYMAVHTFMTGVRGILAPLLAFILLQYLPITTVALISSVLILFSIFVLFLCGPFKEYSEEAQVGNEA